MKKHILIVGTGGVGGYFGGHLAKAGHHVTFIARGDHLKALKRNGLQVLSPDGSFGKKIKAQNTLPKGSFDLVILCLKAHQKPAFLKHLKSVLAPQGVALSLQNGLDNAKLLQRYLGKQRVIPSFCILGAFVERPGVIRHVAAGKIVMGEHPQSRTWRKVFRAAHFKAEISRHFNKDQWQKLIWNVAFNGPTAMLQLTVGKMLERPEYGQLVTNLIKEALMVAKSENVLLPKSLPRTLVADAKKNLAGVFTSMAMDRQQGRPLEVDIFYGAICQMAKKHRIAVPCHEMVHNLLSSLA